MNNRDVKRAQPPSTGDEPRASTSAPSGEGTQVLHVWSKGLPGDFQVKDLINQIKEWCDEGYVDTSVWKRLNNIVTSDALPTFSEITRMQHIGGSKIFFIFMQFLGILWKMWARMGHLIRGILDPPMQQMSRPAATRNVPEQKSVAGSLEDCHILQLSKMITNGEELTDLGVIGLKLPEHIIKTALYNHSNDIHTATHNVLTTWFKKLENRQEAYTNLCAALKDCEMNHLAAHLIDWVEGKTEISQLSAKGIADLQRRVKGSLKRRWKDCLQHDWIPAGKALNFPLTEFYTDLKWARKVKKAMKHKKTMMTSMYEILDVKGAGEEPINILVEGKPGSGKTSSMAMLAMKWVDGADFPFDLVFLIPLRKVNKNSSLAELVVAEHDQLKDTDTKTIRSILEGETNHKVLLLLDGYDEYSPGTNKEVDKAIESTVGKCFIILTSRPGLDSGEATYVSQEIRSKMDGEVKIEGFSEENIRKCAALYLGSEEECKRMLKQAKDNSRREREVCWWEGEKWTGFYELLSIPIILLMTCVLFEEKKSLPKLITPIYQTIYELAMDRTTLKNFGRKSAELQNLDELLYVLGEAAWKALQSKVKQLLLNKEDLEKKDPDILKLGLLHQVDAERATLREEATYVSFEHKTLQEFSSAKYTTKRLETAQDVKETLKELFPSLDAVRRHEQVVVFTCGLMRDPTPLVDHVYQLCVDDRLDKMRKVHSPLMTIYVTDDEASLFESLYRESAVTLPGRPLHNQHINYNTTPVYTPSKLYVFQNMRTEVDIDDRASHDTVHESGIYIVAAARAVSNSLSVCSKLPPVTDLWLEDCGDKGRETRVPVLSKKAKSVTLRGCRFSPQILNDGRETRVPVLSKKAKSVTLRNCWFSPQILNGLFEQISERSTITGIDLNETSLKDVTSLNISNNTSLTSLQLRCTDMSQSLSKSILQQVNYLEQLEYLDLTCATLTGCLSNFLADPHPGLHSLKELYLMDTKLKKDDGSHMFHVINGNKLPRLVDLYLSRNTLTGCLSDFLPDPHTGLHSLEELGLDDTELNKDDVDHVTLLISSHKLPRLEVLALTFNNLSEEELEGLLDVCVTSRNALSKLYMEGNDVSEAFEEKWSKRCYSSNICLFWTAD